MRSRIAKPQEEIETGNNPDEDSSSAHPDGASHPSHFASPSRASETTLRMGWSATQRALIREEANSILEDPVFRNSKRCVMLFRSLIDHALDGESGGIKERTLGIEVFGRIADYDTNNDSVVRMVANDIRKRLALYYQSHQHQKLTIRIVPGSYVPIFDFHDAPQEVAKLVPAPEPLAENPAPPVYARSEEVSARTWPLWPGWTIAAGLLVAALAVVLIYSNVFRSTQYMMWAPLLGSNEPVTICVGDENPLDFFGSSPNFSPATWMQTLAGVISSHQYPEQLRKPDPRELSAVLFEDTDAAVRAASWLSAHHKVSILRRASTITMEDLRHGPVVIVGAYDNMWSLILLSDLRYRFRVDPITQETWIEDTQNPSQRTWKARNFAQANGSSVDYAIITRILNPSTGKWILAIGGIARQGTEAASYLATDPSFARLLPPALRSSTKNFQMVLKTEMIDGNSGPAQVIAVTTW